MAAIDKCIPHVWRMAQVGGLAIALIATDAAAIFVVNEPWVRLSSTAGLAEAYMTQTSSEGATLVGVRSDETEKIEILAPGTARKSIKEIKLPAGETVMLAPGSYRFVLTGLNRSLKLGGRVPFVLTIEAADGSRSEIALSAEVRRRSPTDDHRTSHKH